MGRTEERGGGHPSTVQDAKGTGDACATCRSLVGAPRGHSLPLLAMTHTLLLLPLPSPTFQHSLLARYYELTPLHLLISFFCVRNSGLGDLAESSHSAATREPHPTGTSTEPPGPARRRAVSRDPRTAGERAADRAWSRAGRNRSGHCRTELGPVGGCDKPAMFSLANPSGHC